MNENTNNLFLRDEDPELVKERNRQEKARQAAITQAKSALRIFELLEADPNFQVYLQDMKERETTAFEALDGATDPTTLAKTVGEYIGIKRAINHTAERRKALLGFLEDNGALD